MFNFTGMILSRGLSVFFFLSILGQVPVYHTPFTDSLEQRLKVVTEKEEVDVLNQLTYAFITNDNEKVLTYNQRAIQLSRQVGYTKGEGIAFTYKGVNEYLQGQLPEAHVNLHRGLRLSKQAGDRANHGYIYLQLGNCSLEEVENDSALLYFRKAYDIYKDSLNPSVLSKIYRNLSAVYGQRYQYDLQRLYLDRSIAIRRQLPDKPLLIDALALKATNLVKTGDLPGAEMVIAEAEKVINNNPEFNEGRNDLRHIRALVLFRKGQFEQAAVLADTARSFYLRSSLMRKYVTLLIDISEVFSDRGEYELALNNLYNALRLSKQRGFDSETYAIRNRIGWINFYLGDFEQALRMANEALDSKPKRQLKGDMANALNLKGTALARLNDLMAASTSLTAAYEIYQHLEDKRGLSETLNSLAALHSQQNNYNEALKLYQQSMSLSTNTNYTLGLASSTWGMGDIYFRLGDFRKAEHYLQQSEKYCLSAHANEILILNYNTRRDLLAAQNRFKESLHFSKMAGDLKDSIHRTDLSRRFVNLEKMQEIEQRDRDIRELQKDNELAEERIRLQESRLKQQFILLLAGLAITASLGTLAFMYYRFYKRIKILHTTILDKNSRIQAQADKLHEMNTELSKLYHEVSEQKEEIQAQATELTENNKSISDLNRNLEQMVEQKTLELRTTNKELIKHNNELLQFSYTVSHNLRGPVARLLGLSSIVSEEPDFEAAKKWITLIQKTTTDLDQIIRDLNKILDIRNEPDHYSEAVDLSNEWKQSISLLQDSLSGHEEITANFDKLPQLITVRAMIQSTFYNLLSNAIKFRSPDRNLKVNAKAYVENGKAIIEVSDNGLGFDMEYHQDKLFKLYKRFHTHVEGRGLGLYLVKSQIEVLHGSIEVQSQPDEGTRFRVILPLTENGHS